MTHGQARQRAMQMIYRLRYGSGRAKRPLLRVIQGGKGK